MAKTVILVDDIDGSSNAETVRFSYDGVAYSIDLSRKNRAAFDKAIKPWVQAATRQSRGSRTRRRQAPRRPARTRSQHSGPDLGAVRSWASENGIEVAQRGRIAQPVIDAYNAAH